MPERDLNGKIVKVSEFSSFASLSVFERGGEWKSHCVVGVGGREMETAYITVLFSSLAKKERNRDWRSYLIEQTKFRRRKCSCM